MKTFRESFKIILTGDMAASRAAAREIRKLVFSPRSDKDTYKEIENIINSAASEYANISEDWRQENFVMAISVMYFLHDREDKPDFLFSWLFHLIQHPNGNVRHAAVRMFEQELGPLTYHIRFPGRESGYVKMSKEQADRILFGLRSNLEALATGSYKPSYRKYRYVHSLPRGTYKSVQHILSCLAEYCSDIDEPTKIESPDEIISRRTEIEHELEDMLKETESEFSLQDVKDVIFHEEGNDDMMKVVMMFDRGGDGSELGDILELVTDAWNYFPHAAIGGKAPVEMRR